MTDTRECQQCGASFAPRREHARFCSARCRVAWNRQHVGDPPAEAGALGWTFAAMQETVDRLLRARTSDRRHGFTAISEAVWWVTLVDASMVRYHPDVYDTVLAGHDEDQRRVIEGTFGGLRFVRNWMGYHLDHSDFIEPRPGPPGPAGTADPGSGLIAAWTWRRLPEPVLAALPARGREWEMARYRDYQAHLAGKPTGETFERAAAFLRLACDGSLNREAQWSLPVQPTVRPDRRGNVTA